MKEKNPSKEDKKKKEKKDEIKEEEKKSKKAEESNQTTKDRAKNDKEIKKVTRAVTNLSNLPISTKKARDVCRFIKGKRIEEAIEDLEEVIAKRKAVPMRGEIPHKKGKGISSGGYPKKVAQFFIKALKNLEANSRELNDPIISLAIANIGSRPLGRFGRIRRKRTHLKLVAEEMIKGGK